MIGYDKHQCTNHFHCIAEINYDNNSISLMISNVLFNSFAGKANLRYTAKLNSAM